jgi:L-threonylcarbamoyladenylate synthase
MGKAEIANGFDPQALSRAASLLASGEIVAFPTETVYGLGADALNAMAVAKIFELKKRPHFDPLIVHVSRMEWVDNLVVSEIPYRARLVMDRFWPGPLTIILPKSEIIPDIVTAGLGTVGLRMPNHPVALDLIEKLGRPIAAPSANPFGYMSTTKAGDVASLFDDRLPLILDGGPCSFGIESTIVSLPNGNVLIHRHGSVSIEELSSAVGQVAERRAAGDDSCEAPGELPYHYAPLTPLVIIAGPEEIGVENSAFLSFSEPPATVKSKEVKVLSRSGDLREAAANFFSYLIELDRKGMGIIYAQKIPEKGLGKAIMERLRKAAQRQRHVNR